MPNAYQPAGTNLLGETLAHSRQQFRNLVTSLDSLIANKKLDEARVHIKKLAALQTELHRLLNPRDAVDQKALAQTDRDFARIEKALAKGWGGSVGRGLLTVILAGTLGVTLIVLLVWKFLGG